MMSKDSESIPASRCPSCGTAAQSDARFCHGCGASLDPRSAPRGRTIKKIAVFGAAALGIVAVTVAVLLNGDPERSETRIAPALFPTSREGPNQPTGGGPSQQAGGQPGQAVDLSTMTPREAADRLFNRIMMASEQGDIAEVLRFAPMALQAYGQLGTLDADAHYHLGRIHAAVGDLDNTRKQIRMLKQFAPNHLLGIVLEHAVAEQARDGAAAAQAYAAFAAAYTAESITERREYAEHRRTIEKFRQAAGGSQATLTVAGLADPAGEGAGLFAKTCAICHGQNASGSDKGPPLVHQIYEPGHHDDNSFYRAARQGVQAHHWSFGDMPPAPGVSNRDMSEIISYVRALQVAAGIR